MGGDPDRQRVVFTRWPVREALLELEALRYREELEEYRFQVLSWQIGGKGDAPRPPEILMERR